MIRPLHHLLFATFGIGFNYLVPVALFLQLPIMQKALPECLQLASRMNLSVNVLPTCLSVFYVLYRSRPDTCRKPRGEITHRSRIKRLRRDMLMVTLLVANIVSATLAAAAWNVVVDGVSLVLYIACALSGLVGAMAGVALMPWVSRFSAELIPSVNTGGAASILLLALLDAAEGPGEAVPRFGASTFFALCAALCTLPPLAFIAIHMMQPLEASKSSNRNTIDDDGRSGGGGKKRSIEITAVPHPTLGPAIDEAAAVDVVVLEDNEQEAAAAAAVQTSSSTRYDNQQPSDTPPLPPPRHLLHYCLLNFIINFICWGMQPALLPLAVSHATLLGASLGPGLQACTMASSVCVTLGHASSAYLRTRRLNLLTSIYLLVACFYLLAAYDVPRGTWPSLGGTIVVVGLVSVSRWIDGLFTSCLSMEICAAYPGEALRKEHVLRVTGLAGSIGTLLGSILASVLVDGIDDGRAASDGSSAVNVTNASCAA